MLGAWIGFDRSPYHTQTGIDVKSTQLLRNREWYRLLSLTIQMSRYGVRVRLVFMLFLQRYRWVLMTGVVVVALAMVCQLASIDWDLGQRRKQKTAFLRMRHLAASLHSFKNRNGKFPSRIEDIHEDFVSTILASNKSNDRDFAESTWHGIIDPGHTWGYVYEYAFLADGSQHYELRASPIERGRSGFRYFYVSDSSPIRWNDDHRASSIDPEPNVDPVLDMHSYWGERLRAVSTTR